MNHRTQDDGARFHREGEGFFHDHHHNPLIPDSVGARLAEEWTIHPGSTLPSFLEMKMMEEIRSSTWHTLRLYAGQLEQYLDRYFLLQQQPQGDQSPQGQASLSSSGPSSEVGEPTTATSGTLRLRMKQWGIHVMRLFHQQILKPYSPEIRFMLTYWLEKRSLQSNQAALISEALYGMKRVKLGGGGGEEKEGQDQDDDGQPERRSLSPMTQKDGIRLAFFITFGYYIKERTERWISHNNSETVSTRNDDSRSSSRTYPFQKRWELLKKTIQIVYPYLSMTAQGLHLLQQWRYLMGQSVFFDPYSKWLDLVARRVTLQDQQEKTTSQHEKTTEDGVTSHAKTMLQKVVAQSGIGSYNRTYGWTLASSVVAVTWLARVDAIRQQLRRRRRRMRQQNDNDNDNNNNDNPSNNHQGNDDWIPPPPKPLACQEKSNNHILLEPETCPLCHSQPMILPTASTSGYVFCWKCLVQQTRQNTVCPVTGKPCPPSNMIRLYEPHDENENNAGSS